MSDRFEHLRSAGARAIKAYREHQQELAAYDHFPRPGDVFVFPLETDIALRWALVMTHPDDEALFFAVPGDDFMWQGPTDVPVDDHRLSPLMLRCNHGLWLSRDAAESGRRVGILSDDDVRQARKVLSDMVTGKLSPTPEQLETEEHPEYEDWICDVDDAVEELGRWSRPLAVVLRLDDFRKKRPKPSKNDVKDLLSMTRAMKASAEPMGGIFKLAASPGGLIGGLKQGGGHDGSKLALDAWEGPGKLELVLGDAGLSLTYEADDGEPPLARVLAASGPGRVLEWLAFPGGGLWRTEPVALETLRGLRLRRPDMTWIEITFED